MRTVRLLGRLGRIYGPEYRLDVATPKEAVQALAVQLPGFARDVARFGFYAFDERKNVDEDTRLNGDLYIVPHVRLAKNNGALKLLAGIALFAVGFAYGADALIFEGVKGITGQTLMTMGAGMALNGVGQMLSPSPPAIETEPIERRQSYLFSGGANPTEEGNAVPLAYGTAVWCSALMISQEIDSALID